MKKIICVLLALVMAFSFNTFAFADGVSESAETDVTSEKVLPEDPTRGTLYGYGAHWYNSGETQTGSFYVNVTGSGWPWAHATFKINSFGSDAMVRMTLYRPESDGSYTFACGVYETAGGPLTMSSPELAGVTFPNGHTGQYRVDWEIFTIGGSTPSSGRLMCWVY